MTYLDWAATAVPKSTIIEKALTRSLKIYGNPSSTHEVGLEAKNMLNKCRLKCSNLLNCSSESITFTSGATESNNIVLLSFLKKHITGEIITTTIEHPSVSEPISQLKKFGWKVKNMDPNSSGLIEIKKLGRAITEKTKVVSIIWVHNETGVIQPIKTFIDLIRSKEKEFNNKIHIHIDGVQAVGKVKVDLRDLNIDSFSISGHKFGAPKGVGILYLKSPREPLYKGGGQENGLRPGTESIFNAMSISDCLEDSIINLEHNQANISLLMKGLILELSNLGINIIPKSREIVDSNFVPNILSLTTPPIPGEVLARVMNQKGFMISTGSACSSNKKSSTSGILSMGITEGEGFSSFRVSLGRTTTSQEVTNFLKALKESIKELAP